LRDVAPIDVKTAARALLKTFISVTTRKKPPTTSMSMLS